MRLFPLDFYEAFSFINYHLNEIDLIIYMYVAKNWIRLDNANQEFSLA